MSKLSDLLKQASQAYNRPMGLTPAKNRTQALPMVLIAELDSLSPAAVEAAVAAGAEAILALQHRVLPPTIKVGQPPAPMMAEDSPFYVSTEARPWCKPHGYPRRAAISAFGFGGSNTTLVLRKAA